MNSGQLEPLQHTHLSVPPRWSPLPLMFVSCVYGICITGVACMCDTKFRQIFSDFKVSLPMPTIVVLWISSAIWSWCGWIVLIPLLTLWPLLIPRLSIPQEPHSRRAVLRIVNLLIVFVFLISGLVLVLGLFTPMISLIQSVSGPQKH